MSLDSSIIASLERGGAIVNPPSSVRAMMDGYEKQYSPVEWAFRYAGDFKEAVTILSGMNTMEQVEDNLDIFTRIAVDSLTGQDRAFVKGLKKAYLERIAIGCTRCDYCQPCPQGIAGASQEYLAGIGRDADRLFTVLDLGAIARRRECSVMAR